MALEIGSPVNVTNVRQIRGRTIKTVTGAEIAHVATHPVTGEVVYRVRRVGSKGKGGTDYSANLITPA